MLRIQLESRASGAESLYSFDDLEKWAQVLAIPERRLRIYSRALAVHYAV